jgi:hypothetical protein
MIWREPVELPFGREERGQASSMMLAVVAAVLVGAVVLFAFGTALGAKGRHQRAADLAAISAAQVMRELYPRLFEPPFIEPDVPNPRHLEEGQYRALAAAAAVRGGRRNAVVVHADDVTFRGSAFAPTRVTVRVRGEARVSLGAEDRRGQIPIRASATAELMPAAGEAFPATASGGGYDGPLAYRQGKPMRPDVALALDRMAAAAHEEAGLFLSVTSGFRSDGEQAILFAAQPVPCLLRSSRSRRGPAVAEPRCARQWLRPSRGTLRVRTSMKPTPRSASSSAVPDRISGSASSTSRTIVRSGRTTSMTFGASSATGTLLPVCGWML